MSLPDLEAIRAPMPQSITPMYVRPAENPAFRQEFIYEPKLDGYRMLAYVNYGTVKLISKSGRNFTSDFPAIADELRAVSRKVVLDGEVVAFNEQGVLDFRALRRKGAEVRYYPFDILYLSETDTGYNLMNLPLLERKRLLDRFFTTDLSASTHISPMFYTQGLDKTATLIQIISDRKLEGIIYKDAQSKYTPGRGHRAWFKIKRLPTPSP